MEASAQIDDGLIVGGFMVARQAGPIGAALGAGIGGGPPSDIVDDHLMGDGNAGADHGKGSGIAV